MTSRARELFETWFRRLYVDRDLRAIDELRAPSAGGSGLGTDDYRAFVRGVWDAFPELTCSIERCVTEGDDVALLLRVDATTAKGERVSIRGAGFARIVDAKIDAAENVWDLTPLRALVEAPTGSLFQSVREIAAEARTSGGGTTTRFLLIHGCPGDAAAWGPLLPHLPGAEALTLPDHGEAEVAGATVEDHVAFVVDAVRRAPGRTVLVGHSYGTWVACHAAARVADQLDGLVLIGALPDVTGETAAALSGFADALDAGALTAESGAAVAAARWLGPVQSPEQVERIRSLFVSAGAARLSRQLRRCVTASTPVTRTSVPSRVIAIADDGAVPRALSEAVAETLGVPLEVWPGANHFAHWDDPARVARELLR